MTVILHHCLEITRRHYVPSCNFPPFTRWASWAWMGCNGFILFCFIFLPSLAHVGQRRLLNPLWAPGVCNFHPITWCSGSSHPTPPSTSAVLCSPKWPQGSWPQLKFLFGNSSCALFFFFFFPLFWINLQQGPGVKEKSCKQQKKRDFFLFKTIIPWDGAVQLSTGWDAAADEISTFLGVYSVAWGCCSPQTSLLLANVVPCSELPLLLGLPPALNVFTSRAFLVNDLLEVAPGFAPSVMFPLCRQGERKKKKKGAFPKGT